MRPDVRAVRAIDAHAGGATVRLIVDGFPVTPGRTLAQRRAWIERQPGLVSSLLREPRGHADLIAAVLTEPTGPDAAAGLLFLGTDQTPRISGAGMIAATTIALERGLLMPATSHAFNVETAAGLIPVRPTIADEGPGRRVTEVAYRPPAAYVARPALPVVVDGRRVRVDVVWAAAWYAVVDREALGVPAERDGADAVRDAARRLLGALEPSTRGWPAPRDAHAPLEAVVLTGPPGRADADLRSVTIYADGTIDRSPSGGGTVAVLAILDAMGVVDEGARGLHHEGPTGQVFRARVVGRQPMGEHAAIAAEITGAAWIVAEHTFLFDPGDPLAPGFVA